jgi:hypothetical protein
MSFKSGVCTENTVHFDLLIESLSVGRAGRADILPPSLGGSLFKSKSRLEAENAAQQLIVLQRNAGSSSRTAIAFSSSSCIAGFHRPARCLTDRAELRPA